MSAKHTPGRWVVAINSPHIDILAETAPTGDEVCRMREALSGGEERREQDAANAHLIAAAPDLLAALTAYADWMTARFDDIAEEFYAATGIMAPGKSQPLGYHDHYEDAERRQRWDAWLKERKAALNDAARSAIARATGGEG